ncbi:MAG: hypothetical protein HRT35_36240 [Algicola sp.]|nr:hypothetical protein [Algicola sp.]
MVTVVTAGGKPSKSRWQLFKDYYDTIYAREQQKAVLPFYGVLNEHKPEIDTLHHEVGFILQCRAEQSGETQADMSIAEFEKMVVNYLQENGLEAANLIEQKNLILGAANERLVFLTSRKKDRLSFEVRSLQEYMAAACITAVDSSEIITRLKIIAHSAYWRNTLLFAIGRFFVDADLRKYRDKIRLLCTDLNRETPQNEACKLGSRLALEILESGSINSTPTFIRHLADGALELLSFAPTSNNNITKRLADIFTPAMQSEYEENIKRWIGLSDQHLTLSAWMLLLYLEESQHAWAAKIVDKNWPDDANHAWLILKTWIFDIREKRGKIKVNHLEVARLEKTIPALSIYDTNWPEFCEKIAPRSLKDSWLHTVIYNRNSHLRIELKNGSKETGMKFRITKIPFDIDKETFNSLFQSCKQKDTHSSWLVLMSIIEFELELDISSLVNALNNIAKNSNSSEWRHWAALSPWPIAYCLNSSSSIFELQEFINKTHNGQLGNVEDWKKIQEAWLENDLELADAFKGFLDEQFSIAFLCSRLATTMTDPKSAMEHSTSLLQQIINSAGEQLGRLPELVEFHATCNQALHLLNPIDLLTYILPCENYLYSNGFLIDQEDPLDNSNDWLKLYDAIGLSDDLKFSPWLDLFPPIDFLLKAYLRDTSRTGLLRLAGFWCAAGASPTINLSTLQPIENYESAQERLAVMILKMSQQDSTDDQTQEIIGHLDGITANTAVPDAKPALLSMIKENSTKIPALTAILHALMTTFTSDEWEMRAESMDSYSAMIQAASSGFDNSLAAKLDLPAVELANNFSLD